MKVWEADFERISEVAWRMRPEDRREVFATRWDDDPEAFAESLAAMPPYRWCLSTDDGDPVMILGVQNIWPGMWAPWAFATERFPEIALGATRFVRHHMIPLMHDKGFRRAECRTLSTNKSHGRWLEACGGLLECTHERLGREGEAFDQYVFYPECCPCVTR